MVRRTTYSSFHPCITLLCLSSGSRILLAIFLDAHSKLTGPVGHTCFSNKSESWFQIRIVARDVAHDIAHCSTWTADKKSALCVATDADNKQQNRSCIWDPHLGISGAGCRTNASSCNGRTRTFIVAATSAAVLLCWLIKSGTLQVLGLDIIQVCCLIVGSSLACLTNMLFSFSPTVLQHFKDSHDEGFC